MSINDWHTPQGPGGPSSANMKRHAVTPQLVLGGFIMAAGVLMTLDRLELLDAARALRFWPLMLVGLGVTLLVQRRDGSGRFWGFGWIFLGSWMLLNSLRLVRVGFWELIWPLLLVLFGLNLVTQTLRRGRAASALGSDVSNLFAVMGESKRSVPGEFRGSQLTAIMGGCILDLRQATIAPGDEATIEVLAFMGGLEIVVPSGWAVVSHIVPIAGAVADKRLPVAEVPAAPGGPAQPRLTIRGVLVFGGLEIKS